MTDAAQWKAIEYGYEKYSLQDERGTEIGFVHRRRDADRIIRAIEAANTIGSRIMSTQPTDARLLPFRCCDALDDIRALFAHARTDAVDMVERIQTICERAMQSARTPPPCAGDDVERVIATVREALYGLSSLEENRLRDALAALGNTQCDPVEAGEDGWSEWFHPLPGYLMQCCDCGLIHEMDFAIGKTINKGGPFNSGESDRKGVVLFRARRAAIAALGTTPSIAPDVGRPYGQPAGHEPSLASRLGPTGDHQAQGGGQ